jgi:hypothetical protein
VKDIKQGKVVFAEKPVPSTPAIRPSMTVYADV